MTMYSYSFYEKDGFLSPYVTIILEESGRIGRYAALVDTGATESLIAGDTATQFNHAIRKASKTGSLVTAGDPIKKYYHSFRVRILASDNKTVIYDTGRSISVCCTKETNWFTRRWNFIRGKEESSTMILGWDILKNMKLYFNPETKKFKIIK